MKQFLMLLAVALTCISLLAATAEAKRLGGGGSIGKQRTMTPQPAPKPPAAAPAPSTAPGSPVAPTQPGNRWLGPLTGLAMGVGLGALFAGGGLGGGMGGILMILAVAAVVMLLISLLHKKSPQAALQYTGTGVPHGNPVSMQSSVNVADTVRSEAASAMPTGNIPADFPVDSFLRSAKISFIRLQAANDRKDLADIREYTTPEMFAEISMLLQERDQGPGNKEQKTEVISIQADLLQIQNEGDLAIASVRFTGQLSENNGMPENIDEIWHVQKNLRDDKSVWLLAGIQQTTLH